MLQMSEVGCEKGYGRYVDFVREFKKSDLKPDDRWKGSMFSNDNSDYYHANIIRFDNKGMIIRNPVELYMVKLYVINHLRKNKRSQRVNWRE